MVVPLTSWTRANTAEMHLTFFVCVYLSSFECVSTNSTLGGKTSSGRADGSCAHQDVEDLVDIFAAYLDSVDLEDLVSLLQQTAPLGRPTLHDAADDHTVHVVTNCRALIASVQIWGKQANKRQTERYHIMIEQNLSKTCPLKNTDYTQSDVCMLYEQHVKECQAFATPSTLIFRARVHGLGSTNRSGGGVCVS